VPRKCVYQSETCSCCVWLALHVTTGLPGMISTIAVLLRARAFK
jgi:hypothetical protein